MVYRLILFIKDINKRRNIQLKKQTKQ